MLEVVLFSLHLIQSCDYWHNCLLLGSEVWNVCCPSHDHIFFYHWRTKLRRVFYFRVTKEQSINSQPVPVRLSLQDHRPQHLCVRARKAGCSWSKLKYVKWWRPLASCSVLSFLINLRLHTLMAALAEECRIATFQNCCNLCVAFFDGDKGHWQCLLAVFRKD